MGSEMCIRDSSASTAVHHNAAAASCRALATAASFAPVSSGAPATPHQLPWLRTTTGYAPVVFARPNAACSARPASRRRAIGRRRPELRRADVALLIRH